MATYKYPSQVSSARDYIRFSFGKYEGAYIQSDPGGAGYNPGVTFTEENSVWLPMPNDIGSNVGGNWGGKDVTGLAQVALQTAGAVIGQAITGDVKGTSTAIANAFKVDTIKAAAGGLAADALTAISTKFSEAPGMGANLQTNDILQLTTGNIINPNTELLYGGTGLRTHGYTFKLIAQDDTEAKTLMNIAKIFKASCAPKSKNSVFGGATRNFIGIPDICEVRFYSGGSENPHLPKYKPSGITSVSVGYITDGQYVSYTDGHPLGITLTVSLTELKLCFSEEFTDGTVR
jgi:hypothetical protein